MYEINKDYSKKQLDLESLSRPQYEDHIICLKDKIENLDKEKQIEIFNNLHKKNIVFSENRNGVFINMNDIPKTVIKELILYIDYIDKQDALLTTIEKEKNEIEQAFLDS